MIRDIKLTSTLLLVAAALNLVSAFSDSDIRYDPENQDGIPVIASRSLAPAISSHYEDHEPTSGDSAQRRNSDADLDDGLEDEDDAEDNRDEYKSGSSNHGTYENPSFGESKRAAQDGDDIESFFDKHLGPQDAIESREDNEVPINDTPLRSSASSDYIEDDHDRDDHYAAAASGPIATIISSIINRRPIVITATTGDGPSDSKAAATSTDEKQTQSLAEAAGETAPVSPLALFAPIAASSNVYDEQEDPTAGADAPVRETIYVSRRPYSPSGAGAEAGAAVQPPHRYQLYPTMVSSAARDLAGTTTSASNAYHASSRREPVMQQYMRHYPVAASHAHQRHRPEPADAADPEDDEQTVSYNLSFGGSSAAAADEEAVDEQGGGPAQSGSLIDEAAYERRPLAGYSSMRSYSPMMMMVTPEQQRYYQQQQQQAMMMQQHVRNPVQVARGGARYHRDPSESVSHQFVQYR